MHVSTRKHLAAAATLCLALCACNPQPGAPALLREAERLAESRPDSAMLLIDSISYPEKSLGGEEYMRYLVTRVRVRYKNHRDITGDTLVFDAVRYFTKHDKNPGQSALAQFYGGCVLREQKRYDRAMQYYKEAETSARKAKDVALQGLTAYNIGDMFTSQGFHAAALDYYKTVAKITETLPDKQIQSFSAIGQAYLHLGHLDSALLFFHKGLELAGSIGDVSRQSLLAQNLSVAYRKAGKYGEVEKYLRKSLQLNTDSMELPRYHLNFAKFYASTAQRDSTALYIDKLKRQTGSLNDDYFKASALNFLADQEIAQGHYEAAFSYQAQRMKTLTRIMEARGNQSVYETERKYNFEQLQKQYYRNLSVRQQWIILLLAVVVAGGTSFTAYWVRQRNRRAETERNFHTLMEMNRGLERSLYQKELALQEKELALEQKDNHLRKKQLSLRNALLWRFGVAQKALDLNEAIKEHGKSSPEKIPAEKLLLLQQFNTIVYGKKDMDEQWDAMLQTFKEACPGYAERIREMHPSLTEKEFRICVLTYADFSVREISVILRQSINTIQTRRSCIRHKMGIPGGGNIAGHLDRIME